MINDDEYTGPPLESFPVEFQEKVHRVSMHSGLTTTQILWRLQNVAPIVGMEYLRQKKLARKEREEQRKRRHQHRRKKRKCRSKTR